MKPNVKPYNKKDFVIMDFIDKIIMLYPHLENDKQMIYEFFIPKKASFNKTNRINSKISNSNNNNNNNNNRSTTGPFVFNKIKINDEYLYVDKNNHICDLHADIIGIYSDINKTYYLFNEKIYNDDINIFNLI